jgi:hypothetical protein
VIAHRRPPSQAAAPASPHAAQTRAVATVARPDPAPAGEGKGDGEGEGWPAASRFERGDLAAVVSQRTLNRLLAAPPPGATLPATIRKRFELMQSTVTVEVRLGAPALDLAPALAAQRPLIAMTLAIVGGTIAFSDDPVATTIPAGRLEVAAELRFVRLPGSDGATIDCLAPHLRGSSAAFAVVIDDPAWDPLDTALLEAALSGHLRGLAPGRIQLGCVHLPAGTSSRAPAFAIEAAADPGDATLALRAAPQAGASLRWPGQKALRPVAAQRAGACADVAEPRLA